jgi:uncharacterized surface protein with fasciclin (FAS1) repeats
MRKFSLFAMIAILLTAFAVSAQEGELTTKVRFAHLSPDTPAVEVFINGDSSLVQVLSYPEISGWIEVPAGTYEVAVAPYGAGIEAAAIGPANFSLPSGAFITVAATGSLANGTLGADIISENYSRLNAGEARVTVFHGIEDAPAVDVILGDGTVLISSLAFGESANITVPSDIYDLAVVPAGTTSPIVINLARTALADSTYYFVAARGSLASPGVALSAISLGTVDPLIDKRFITQTITDIVVNSPNFSTLETAVVTAGLADTLAGAGEFTVFAPTNAAFAALGEETLNAVLADNDLLTTILLYHVLGGKALASDVVGESSLNMLAGGSVSVSVVDGEVFLNGNVKITTTNIEAANGVIHVIDTVLIP